MGKKFYCYLLKNGEVIFKDPKSCMIDEVYDEKTVSHLWLVDGESEKELGRLIDEVEQLKGDAAAVKHFRQELIRR